MSAQPLTETLAAAWEATAGSLPGADRPEVVARRRAALDSFRSHGLPTQKLEAWKFTGLTALERPQWVLPANDGADDAQRLDPKRDGVGKRMSAAVSLGGAPYIKKKKKYKM